MTMTPLDEASAAAVASLIDAFSKVDGNGILDKACYRLGEIIAERRAGEWPASGTLLELESSVNRAEFQVLWNMRLEYKWIKKIKAWVPDRPLSRPHQLQAYRMQGRREKAREIASRRTALLRRLLAEYEGVA